MRCSIISLSPELGLCRAPPSAKNCFLQHSDPRHLVLFHFYVAVVSSSKLNLPRFKCSAFRHKDHCLLIHALNSSRPHRDWYIDLFELEFRCDKQTWAEQPIWILDDSTSEHRLSIFRSKRSDVGDFTRSRYDIVGVINLNNLAFFQAPEILQEYTEIDPN